MAKIDSESPYPELREYVMEHDERLYNFCLDMVGEETLAGNLAVSIFRAFGSKYKKMAVQK